MSGCVATEELKKMYCDGKCELCPFFVEGEE